MSDDSVEVEAVRRPLKTSPCRGCGKPIIWAVSLDGTKKIPLDPRAPVYDVTIHPEGNGERYVVTISTEAYVNHFATCPDANKFSASNRRADSRSEADKGPI